LIGHTLEHLQGGLTAVALTLQQFLLGFKDSHLFLHRLHFF
jgi:hypothetical protein